MENLRDEHSLETYLKAFEFLSIWAVVHPAQFAGLMDRLSDFVRRIKAQIEKDRSVELARMVAVALEKFCDEAVDEAVTDAGRDAFAKYGSRTDVRYTLIFPENLSEALKPVGGDEQGKFVKNVLTRIDEDPEYNYLKGRAAQIRKAQETLDAATKQKKEREREEDLNRADRDRLKKLAAEEYRFFHPELMLKFRDDPKRVELFFLTLGKNNNKGPKE